METDKKNNNRREDILIIVQARMNSSRLPGKVLSPIQGKPLLIRLLERLAPLTSRGKIIVATSTQPVNIPIEQLCLSLKIDIFKGEEEDVLNRFIAAAQYFKGKTIVRVTADNPLTDVECIEKLLDRITGENWDYVAPKGLPLGVGSEVCTLNALERAASMTKNPSHRENVTSFLYYNPLKFKVWYEDFQATPFNRPDFRLTVDTEEDRLLMEAIFKTLGDNPPLLHVIRLLDSHPELVEINDKVVQRTVENP